MAPKQLRVCAFVMAAVLAGMGCADAGRERAPNVLFVMVDTLRADRLGAYGSNRGLTPFLDGLAARGCVFANAYTTSSWTLPAIASLFTSRLQTQHRIVGFRSQLEAEEETLAEVLSAGGYRSIGYSANPLIAGPRGYGQGFEDWAVYRPEGFRKGGRPLVRASFLSKMLLNGFDAAAARGAAPTFLYAHYIDPHSPYDPPKNVRDRYVTEAITPETIAVINEKLRLLEVKSFSAGEAELLEALYDAEVAYLDAELRKLFAELDARGFLADTIVVVTSDHGEEFFEHGMVLHGLSLYEESVRVPLIVVAPDLPGGSVVDERVSLLDLAPTLLELTGTPSQASFLGRSLLPLMRGRTGGGGDALAERASTPIVLELESKGEKVDLRVHESGLISGSRKLLLRKNGRADFYDLALDPQEERAAPAATVPAAAPLQRALDALAADQVGKALPVGKGHEPSEEEKEHLRTLGYIVD